MKPEQSKQWLLAAAILCLTFLAYQPIWHAGFIWDDDVHLTTNPAMTAPHGLRMIWSSLAISRYYPLTLTSFWAQRQLWGLNPLPFHLVNVLLHGINGILIYFVLRQLRVPAAWLAAMVWTLHPVNVESVAWITELKNTQSGAFFFFALLCFLRFDAHQRRRWYVLALLCGAGALLSKPSTVVLPLVLLLCAWWERGSWRRTDLMRTAPFFGLSLGMSALTILEQRGHIQRIGTADWSMGAAERFVIAGKAIWFYAVKLLWPANLTFVYPRWEVATDSFWSWMPLAGALAIGIVLYQRRREPWARAGALGLGFFVVALLPVLGFFDVFYFRFSFVADHFQYLASLGVIALVASLWTRLCELRGRLGQRLNAVAVPAIVMILGLLTWRQAHVYQNLETLWRDTLAKNPSCWMAHGNLAALLTGEGRTDEAIRQCEQALRLRPDYPEAHNNLAGALLQAGQVDGVIAHLHEALRLRPDFAQAHDNLGKALSQAGHLDDAIGHFEQALRINPYYAEAHRDLALALEQTHRVREAIGHYELALRLNPGDSGAQNNLAWLFATLPLAQGGDPVHAVTLAQQACQLTNNQMPPYLDTLAAAYAATGRFNDAVAAAQKAIDLANSAGQLEMAKQIEPRLRLYRRGQIYRSAVAATPPKP